MTEMTRSNEFIAIRKATRSEREAQLEHATPAVKRSFILEDASHSRRIAKLERLDLLRRDLGSTDGVFEPLRRKAGGFTRLGYLGAYVVHAESQAQAEDAKAELCDDYHLVPNIALGLPPSMRTEIRGPRRSPNWPDDTGIAAAHADGIRGDEVKVMVLDTGCDADHIQFSHTEVQFRYVDPLDPRNLRDVRGFDTHGHGTHVCGIVAGKDTGVAPDVDLYVGAVIESETVYTSLERVFYGLDWLLSQVVRADSNGHCVLLNMSLGFRPVDIDPAAETELAQSIHSALRTLVDDFDVLPIVAAGNDGPDQLRMPAVFPEVLSVGALDFKGKPAMFTSTGAHQIDGQTRSVPDVWGYGVDVYSSLERNSKNRSRYALKSGTSMATPYVTGIAALHAQRSRLQGSELRRWLIENADSATGLIRYQ